MKTLLPPDGAESRAQKALKAAEAAVRKLCGWHVAPVIEETLTLDGSGTRSLFVPSLRVVEITACTVLGREVDPASLEWSEKGFLRRNGGVWPDRLRAVTLTLSHGFDEVTDVAAIVQEIADRAVSAIGGRTSETAGGVTIRNAQTAAGVSGGVVVMEHERAALEAYRVRART